MNPILFFLKIWLLISLVACAVFFFIYPGASWLMLVVLPLAAAIPSNVLCSLFGPPLASVKATDADKSAPVDYEFNGDGKVFNVDGTPMCGSLDINGNAYGTPTGNT